MFKKIAIGIVILLLVAGLGLSLWVRAFFSGDGARSAVEAQMTKALGQPVAIGKISGSLFPRVTMTLEGVRIGEPARITAERLHVGTSFRALLSRRIEHAVIQLTGARVELPLPAFAFQQASGESSGAPVDIVSIDEISLTNVELVSGGRTLRGDVELIPEQDGAVTLRRIALSAENTSVTITGRIADFSGPKGELNITAGSLDVLEVLGFASAFSQNAVSATPASQPAPAASGTPASTMDMSVSVEAARALFGSLALDSVTGQARVTNDAVTLTPVRFGVFGGRYDGSLTLALSNSPAFRLGATLSGVDMAQVTTFVGRPGSMTGRLAGRVDLSGRGTTPDALLQSVDGKARVDATNGSISNLGLVRAVVLAGSMRQDSLAAVDRSASNEPFSRLGTTLAIARGTASTDDLLFESDNLVVRAAGGFRLDGSAVNLACQIQLSDALSKQAGRDLVRYTQQDGRVTLPATVTGSLGNLNVRIDAADIAKRAIVNRANEEAKKAIEKGLGRLLGR